MQTQMSMKASIRKFLVKKAGMKQIHIYKRYFQNMRKHSKHFNTLCWSQKSEIFHLKQEDTLTGDPNGRIWIRQNQLTNCITRGHNDVMCNWQIKKEGK